MIATVVLSLAVLISLTRFPESAPASADRGSLIQGGARELVGRKSFVLAVAAQFFYVGAQVGIWSYLIRYAQGTVPGTPEKTAADYLIASLAIFMVGRFVGTALLRYVAPGKLLGRYALINTLLTAVAVFLPGRIGLVALIATSFFMSIMFPTIFALGIRDLGESRKLASSVLVMSIIGGALLTPLMGALSGYAGINSAMVVPCASFLVVLYFAAYAGAGKR
jgi:FHS family L-fucose permease-like MFS transporter